MDATAGREVVPDPTPGRRRVPPGTLAQPHHRDARPGAGRASGKEQISRIDEYHRYSTLGSALLFSGTHFDGSSRFVPSPWPNLKWWPYTFNDKTSSLACWGALNIFFEHHWYSGRRLYVFGPYAQIEDLGGAGFTFDNLITSKW